MSLKIHGTVLDDSLIVNDDKVKHVFEREDLLAVWGAYTAGRPLLLRGKPGTGKSQLAKAIAHKLKWPLVTEVLHGGRELEDLHWRYDAIQRLGDAQSMAYQHNAGKASVEDNTEKLAHENYIRPAGFWWAYDWGSAKEILPEASSCLCPDAPEGWQQGQDGVVLLIDEMDKAEPDLPNGLLQTLGDLEFTVPYVNQRIKANPKRVLIIITTNEERELPTALVRRCYTHTLKLDKKEQSRIDWLKTRGELHFGDAIDGDVYTEAAELLWKDRQDHKRYPPGLAEYLDLLRAIATLEDKTQQAKYLKDISHFVYDKEKEED